MRFRPTDDPRNKAIEGDPHPGGPVEWEDNWLSNFFAWGSYRFIPTWCQTPEHWTARVTQYLFVDCPCCLLFRGLCLGLVLGTLIGIVTTLIAVAL